MCGIVGIVAPGGLHADALELAVQMREVLSHRGPDDAGLWADAHAVLAHRRLSIIDVAGGHQPMSNEDGSIWITYNGEIYNHLELRRDLEARGHRYRTHADTETIVHAYEEWGDTCVTRLRGMFAFAIWDTRRRRLLLARDRLGIKPLYYARRGDTLLFGSEIKAILASGRIDTAARLELVPEVLGTRMTAGDATLFRGVHRVEPGHLLTFEDGRTHISQYWDVPIPSPGAPPTRSVVPRFKALLEESVRLRLMSDVPIGVFLSGGIDSSAIAALMARHTGGPLQAFSVAFEERAFSELEYSRQVARAIGAHVHEAVIGARDFFAALPRLLWHEDEPIAHPSSVPLYYVSALARRHVTVVLTGEGSDELLAGYGKYFRVRWNWRVGGVYERAVPAAVRRAIAHRLVRSLPPPLQRYASRTFLALARTPDAMVFDNFAAIRQCDQESLLAPELPTSRAYEASRALFDRLPAGSTLLDRLLYSDLKTYLVELLMKQDQMSMAASIESRVPFLDHHLVEFAATLPDSWKLAGSTTKRVLRHAMRGVVPDRILTRSKMGFPVPFGAWVRGPWQHVVRDVLLDRRSRERGVLNTRAVEQLIADHVAGRTNGGDRLWSLLNLELWFRTFVDGEGPQTLPNVPDHASSRARTQFDPVRRTAQTRLGV